MTCSTPTKSAARSRTFGTTPENLLGVLGYLLVGLEDGCGVAAAMGMPPSEFEVLRIPPCKLVADVGERVWLTVMLLY